MSNFNVYTYPLFGRLADGNCNRNLKPQLDNRNTENGIKIFWKICHKIFKCFLLGRTCVNTNSLKSFKFLRKVNLHCRKCKNVQISSLKQIFCKALSLNDTWAPQSYFQYYFQGLYVFSINFKKIGNSLRFGVRPQLQQFRCGNRTLKAGMCLCRNFLIQCR